ncbi:YvrJ family protein [Romboutsia sp. 1001285H_161024_C4]|uniref:YvrJ family protein n=1 Tax=Romboutsia sp. 1001285H_161024_C4 TaxID=2787109 RepID=UPI00189918B8|nr:YvrJ family protein [Romboutsia sp. 1001285H_161024_C4]
MEFDIQTLISDIGFPITLSMYLLIRIEGKLLDLTDSINNLSKNILSIKKG